MIGWISEGKTKIVITKLRDMEERDDEISDVKLFVRERRNCRMETCLKTE